MLKRLAYLIPVVFLVYAGVASYSLARMDIHELILCSEGGAGVKVPPLACKAFMVNFRMTNEDINNLSQGAGLDFILSGDGPDKYLIATMFIDKGLSVDSTNHNTKNLLRPLHSAVLNNDIEKLEYLISQGANVNLKSSGDLPLTPLELARHLVSKDNHDRAEIIALLETTKS